LAIGGAALIGRSSVLEPDDLLWHSAGPDRWEIAPGNVRIKIVPQSLPNTPFKLEVVMRFSATSDPGAYWVVRTRYITVYIFSAGYYYLASNPRSVSTALQPNGDFNRLTFTIDPGLHATFSLNGKVEWQGVLDPRMLPSTRGDWLIEAHCNCPAAGRAILTWAWLALYR
jgi:hypothetical protein